MRLLFVAAHESGIDHLRHAPLGISAVHIGHLALLLGCSGA